MLEFTKMQGLGNDYIYIDATKMGIKNPNMLAKYMSDRHFGVGADGLILILPSSKADFSMRMLMPMVVKLKCVVMGLGVLLSLFMINV